MNQWQTFYSRLIIDMEGLQAESSLVAIEVVRHLDIHVAGVHCELLGVKLLTEHLLVLLYCDDLDVVLVSFGTLKVSDVVVVADDPEPADVAAGDLAAVFALGASIVLIDAHGAATDAQSTVEGRLPGEAVPEGVSAEICDRVQVASTTRPAVHGTLWLAPWVPRRLSRGAVASIEAVAVDEEAVARVGARHLAHIASDTEGSPGAILMQPEGTVREVVG
eukprot:CAMPEP_0170450574 /NCGR_PEP_ID=MMETSP0123-20130129/60_1 /TAXON_ID=182087 /ORGANISM="Favella ehrenbergii, Strain Fehren 1" /LENGTH=219 /DNA_ID=CAMNT_0010711891 /DNA_START=66 /DNA_END=727 /DNA_ORIENTATION=+